MEYYFFINDNSYGLLSLPVLSIFVLRVVILVECNPLAPCSKSIVFYPLVYSPRFLTSIAYALLQCIIVKQAVWSTIC